MTTKTIQSSLLMGLLFCALLSATLYAQDVNTDHAFVPKRSYTIQTSRSGDQLNRVDSTDVTEATLIRPIAITISTDVSEHKQRIVGIGGSMTESSAWVLNQLDSVERQKVITQYFHPEKGIGYSMSRLHVGSADFSVASYNYAPTESFDLHDFSIDEDRDDVLPLIKDALSAANDSIWIIASPWSGPPWMKQNWWTLGGDGYFGGKIEEHHKPTFALYVSKFITAYHSEGVPIWAITPENEPIGNSGNFESMEFSAEEMAAYIGTHLGPRLEADHPAVKMFAFDQNKDEMLHWSEVLTQFGDNNKYIDGIAVHWYSSTTNHYPGDLDEMHKRFGEFPVLGTEHSIDHVAHESTNLGLDFFGNDEWFWDKSAGGWGAMWGWPRHEFVSPVYRVARDIMIDLNHWVIGWIDWNIVLNRVGGPNPVGNYCTAPIMVDTGTKEVYVSPLYYTMGQFSKYIRPGAIVLKHSIQGRDSLLVTPVLNNDGTMAIVILNDQADSFEYTISINGFLLQGSIIGEAIQTIIVESEYSISASESKGMPESSSSVGQGSSSEEVESESSESSGSCSSLYFEPFHESSSSQYQKEESSSLQGESREALSDLLSVRDEMHLEMSMGIMIQGTMNIMIEQTGVFGVELFDVYGKKIFTVSPKSYSTGNYSMTFSTDRIADGVYGIRLVLQKLKRA